MATSRKMNPEKRKTKRIPVQVPASLVDQNSQADASCAVMDISPDGIGVLLNLNQAIDPQGVLKFTIDIPPEKVFASGKIIWIRELQKSKPYNYAVGLEFFKGAGTHPNKQPLLDYARSLAGRYEDQMMEAQGLLNIGQSSKK